MNTRVVLAKRPVGWVDESCFAVEACSEPTCGPEGVLLESIYLSTDPYLRGRMNAGPSYAPGFELGQAIVSRVVARVIESKHARFRAGDVAGASSIGRGAAWRRVAKAFTASTRHWAASAISCRRSACPG
jgi:NADPH-dependent curcumin reductase CurA